MNIVKPAIASIALCLMQAPLTARAQDQEPTPPKAGASAGDDFASSSGIDTGDHFRLSTDVSGFIPVSALAPNKDQPRCAGAKSTYSKLGSDSQFIYVKFYKIFKPSSTDTCPLGNASLQPYKDSVYKIAIAEYERVDFKSNGLAFGGLVVPFKFRLGSDKKLVASTTIAPYIGLRWSGFQRFGFECMPVASAGLALVPITPPGEATTETRAAFSTALGFTVTSSKSSAFSAGILLGKDYLNKNDRIADPSVNKAWISIWLGISR